MLSSYRVLSGIAMAASLLLIGLITFWYYKYFKLYRYYIKCKGPRSFPIIGSLYRIGSSTDIIPVLMDYHRKYGPVLKMWFGFNPKIVVSDHKLAEKILQSNTMIDKSYDYNFFHDWLGMGLLTSTGQQWKTQRKLLTPAFHFQILEQFIGVFNAQSDVLIDTLRNRTHNGSFDVFPYINLCALDIICETIMGINIEAQTGNATEYTKAVTEITEVLIRRSFSPLKQYELFFWLSRDYQIQKRALKIMNDKTSYVIKNRQAEVLKNGTLTKNEAAPEKKRMAFLDLLLQCTTDGKPLPMKSIQDQVETFMFEGHDTTTSAVCFVLYCLSQNQEVQENVVRELREVANAPLTYKDLQNMKYLEMVIKESMRLYPPVPIFGRMLRNKAELDGTVFCEGFSIIVFSYGLHRQEDVFPNPEKFDPERFTPENSMGRSPYAYVPFSAGPRNCIGQKFVMLEMKSVISNVLLNYKILPAPGYKPILVPDAILRSTNGIMIQLETRKV